MIGEMSMNSISERIKKIHDANHSDYEFPKKNGQESYYIKYNESSHENSILMEYSSNEIVDIRKRLGKIWEKDDIAKTYLPVVLMAMTNQELWSDSKLGEVDLYNYMM